MGFLQPLDVSVDYNLNLAVSTARFINSADFKHPQWRLFF